VIEVATSVDKNTNDFSSQNAQNYKIRIMIQGSSQELGSLRPGMSARVAVLAQEVKNVLTVPLQAVQERDSRSGGLGLLVGTKPVVFIVKDGKAEERTIRSGTSTRRAVEVIEGVSEGETILTGPAKALTSIIPGTKVKVHTEAEALKGRIK
jgi:HlyD family secretion protein